MSTCGCGGGGGCKPQVLKNLEYSGFMVSGKFLVRMQGLRSRDSSAHSLVCAVLVAQILLVRVSNPKP